RSYQNAVALGGQLLQMDARAFVRTVLAPHHGKDADFGFVGFALQNRADFFKLASSEVAHACTATIDLTIDSSTTRPSAEPRSTSEARSGCGIMPITLRSLLQMPAISRNAPLGLSRYRSTTRSSASRASSVSGSAK